VNPVQVSQIAKSFGDAVAVDDISFEVQEGEIFGLLGPNGAGKTTAIRVILDIFKPDKGTVDIFGGPMEDDKKTHIGYMPEERGLYQDVRLDRCLLYLASLKDISDDIAQERLGNYLERFDLTEHKNKKVKELSKGMQQKAQIIATLLHQPTLIIIDEPFTALDPLNVQLVKDLMHDLRNQGVTIIMSTHQMHQVEELCDRILLIDKGRDVLYGNLAEIRHQFSGHEVLVRTTGQLPSLNGVKQTTSKNGTAKLTLEMDTIPQDILYQLTHQHVNLEKFEIAVPPLDEIFIQVVKNGRASP
jgi:ABC-2 type transport system ATP-binding protein